MRQTEQLPSGHSVSYKIRPVDADKRSVFIVVSNEFVDEDGDVEPAQIMLRSHDSDRHVYQVMSDVEQQVNAVFRSLAGNRETSAFDVVRSITRHRLVADDDPELNAHDAIYRKNAEFTEFYKRTTDDGKLYKSHLAAVITSALHDALDFLETPIMSTNPETEAVESPAPVM